MAKGHLASVVRQVRRLIGAAADDADSGLLERFVHQRDADAFAAIVERHGPLVFGVCRQVLQQPQDAEDSFQACFLVLARKADSIRQGQSLAGWLYRVAYHMALRSRVAAARRRASERQAAEMILVDPIPDPGWRELQPVLHEEVNRLSAKYREPVVLCYLQGKSHEQAARELGWPIGTVKGRLGRARALLRQRLTRRGLTLAACLFAAEVSRPLSTAAVPASLANQTVQQALPFALGQAAVGVVSARPAALAMGALHAMFVSQMKTMAALILLGLLGAGAGMLLYTRAAVPQAVPEVAEAADLPAVRWMNLAGQAGAQVVLRQSSPEEGAGAARYLRLNGPPYFESPYSQCPLFPVAPR